MITKTRIFLAIYAIILGLYYPALTTYFSHDDFFHFKVSITDGSLENFYKLFGFYSFDSRGIAFYRPLFREFLYNTFYQLFGLNAYPFRILQFVLHFINVFLVYKIVQKISNIRFISYFAAFFFGICAANAATFYYLAGGIQVQGATMFILLTLLLFDRHKVISFITFLAAISSHELAAVTPILLSGMILSSSILKAAKEKIFKLWPFFLTVSIYAFINIRIIGFSSGESQYQLDFNPKTLVNSAMWYTTWALGAPETLIDFVNPGFNLNPSLMKYWGNYYRIIFSAIILTILTISFFILIISRWSKKFINDKSFWFFTFWFPTALLPILFLPQHKSTYYLYPALPAFWASIGILFYKAYKQFSITNIPIARAIAFSFYISLVSLSATSAVLGRTTYWAATRGKLAEKIIKNVTSLYPTLPKGSGIYFTNHPDYPFVAKDWQGSSKQAYFALNGEDGLQLIYNDSTLRVFYEDNGGVPIDFPKNKIVSIVATY